MIAPRSYCHMSTMEQVISNDDVLARYTAVLESGKDQIGWF